MHDGSPEVLAGFPMTGKSSGGRIGSAGGGAVDYAGSSFIKGDPGFGDTGTAARFYYCAKASRAERERGLTHREPETVGDGRAKTNHTAYQRGATQRLNIHPTVKPVSVMRWLVRLVTPPGGTVLDPYAGSGTTGIAATLEGFDFVGCELSHEYADLARGRIAHARANPRQWEPDAEPLDEPNEDQLDMFT
jgi:site-specific DNA-methyltransferase (adenine-specific)